MRKQLAAAIVIAGLLGASMTVSAGAQPRVVDPALLPTAAELKAMQAETDRFDGGNRPAGSPAELAYIDYLEGELQALGLETFDDPFTFDRWNPPSTFSLEILEGPDAGAFDVAAYVPFSGTGTAEGVTAPLVHAAIDPRTGALEGDDVTGKIVVVDVPPAPLPFAVFKGISYYEYDPDDDLHPWDLYNRTWVAQAGMWQILDRLTDLGAAGLVAVLDLPEEAAKGAYFPYDGNVRDVPGVYVDREVGAALKQAATGVPARLIMDATVTQGSPSRNLMAYIPGASDDPGTDDLLVLHSHTDGPNSLEDNGPPAVLALADYFLTIPQAERPKSILILFTSGHFSGWVGARHWIEKQTQISQRIAMLISLEHLGAREYIEQPDGSYALTGRNEPGGIFISHNEPLVSESIKLIRDADARRHFVERPFYPSREYPGELGWPGEATEFEVAGIPSLQYITGPQYLLNWGVDTTEVFTDYDLMRRLIIGFAQLVHNIEHVPAEELRSKDPTTVGEPLSP